MTESKTSLYKGDIVSVVTLSRWAKVLRVMRSCECQCGLLPVPAYKRVHTEFLLSTRICASAKLVFSLLIPNSKINPVFSWENAVSVSHVTAAPRLQLTSVLLSGAIFSLLSFLSLELIGLQILRSCLLKLSFKKYYLQGPGKKLRGQGCLPL